MSPRHGTNRPGASGGGERSGRGGAPVPLGEVLQKLLKDLRIEERTRGGGVAAAWERVVGEDLAGRARPVSHRGGTLVVEVEGAALLQELQTFRAAEILEALRADPGGKDVREVRYVPGGRGGRG